MISTRIRLATRACFSVLTRSLSFYLHILKCNWQLSDRLRSSLQSIPELLASRFHTASFAWCVALSLPTTCHCCFVRVIDCRIPSGLTIAAWAFSTAIPYLMYLANIRSMIANRRSVSSWLAARLTLVSLVSLYVIITVSTNRPLSLHWSIHLIN